MFKQLNIDKSTILGSAAVGRVVRPYLTGTQRKNPPDMTSTVPYFPALSGKSLTITIEGDVNVTFTIVFTGNSMTQTLSDINVNPDIEATDTFGYLTITSKHSGNRNSIKVAGGTATSILGFYVDPHPMSICIAGEIDSGKPTYYENRSKGSTTILEREPVQKEVFNRSSAGVAYILDTLLSNLNREIAIVKEYSVTIAGSSFTIPSDDRFYLPIDNIFIPNPTKTQLEKVVTITDDNHNLLFDSSGDRVGVTSITYGPFVDNTQTFTTWTVADGKSVFGPLTHYQKVKETASVTEIVGNIVYCPGASFVSNKVQVNDVVSINGSTNSTPYNHDGEYVVDEVISEEYLRLRPKGMTDPYLISSYAPSSLNPARKVGEIYGTLTVYLGKFCPLNMYAGSMTFNLSSPLNGTYKVALPIGKTVSSILQSDLVQHLQKESGGQLEVGSKITDPLVPRIIAKPTTKTLLLESSTSPAAFRIYLLLNGGVELTYNAKWNGVVYVKDDVTKTLTIIKESVDGVLIKTDNLYIDLNSTTEKVITKYQVASEFFDGMNTTLTIPVYTGLVNGNSTFKSGIYLGSGFSSDTEHLVPKIQFNSNSAAGKYTLLSETILAAGRKREYVKDDGTAVTTVNASWDGSQWLKDVSANSSTKEVLDSDTLKVYGNSNNTASFSDTNWSYRDKLRKYIIEDDFLYPQKIIHTLDVVDSLVSDRFIVVTSTNSSHRTDLYPQVGNYGELICGAKAIGAFSGDYASNMFSISAVDFELCIKAKAPTPTDLAVQSASKQGVVIGITDPGTSHNVWLKAASDVATWYCQAGSTLGDIYSTSVNTNQWVTAIFKRVNGTLYTYINGSLIDTRSFSLSLTGLYLTLFCSGTSTANNNDMFNIDYIKFWAANLDR